MDIRYRYGHRPGRRRRTRIFIVVMIALIIFGAVAAVVFADIHSRGNQQVQGISRTIVQAQDDSVDKLTVDAPTYTMELPGDWREVAHRNDVNEHSTTWQSSKKGDENRSLKLYVDTIPAAKSINQLLPVTVLGAMLSPGDPSENCATFTKGGSLDVSQALHAVDTPAKYQSVDFICDLRRVNDQEMGSGSTAGINTVVVTGPQQGTHKYFFLYSDHNIQPNATIFSNAIKSFRAK
jgi:hypothetical protein